MKTRSTLEERTVTYDRHLAPGIAVHITGVPAEIVHTPGEEDLTLFERGIDERLSELLDIARTRIANGETEITIHFASGV